MKLRIALIMLCLLLGCVGQEDCAGPDLSNNSIVWQGYASENPDPQFAADIDKTITCLKNIDPHIVRINLVSPYIIITEKTINDRAGHFYFCINTITAWDQGILIHYSIVHEAIHWATGLGNEAHRSIYFQSCKYPF